MSAPQAELPVKRVRIIFASIVALYLLVQLAGLRTVGLTDDDDFYIPAGISYVGWLSKAFTFQKGAWSQAGVDAAFQTNKEHPPIAKYVFGVCHHLFSFLGPTDSARVGTVLFSTLAAAILLLMALRHLGAKRGLFAGGLGVLFLLTMPRFYFHSHAATLDVPVASMYLVTAYLALRAERSRRAAWWVGPVFGLASATKLNAPFLVVPYLTFAALVRRGRGQSDDVPPSPGLVPTPTVPFAAFSMAILGPLTFFLVWPHMWFDLFKRVGEYVGFHLNHYPIYFLYFGRVYDIDPFAPWHAPVTMAATTMPLATSALALCGLLWSVKVIKDRLVNTQGADSAPRQEGDLLLSCVLHAAVTVAVVCFSGGPKYGGAKLFMPFFPFWCLLAGYGGLRLWEHLAQRSWGRVASGSVLALALASAVSMQIKFGGYALSQYNGAIGGLRGATAVGFERQYYDIAFRDLVAWLSEKAPQGARIHFLPNNWEYQRTYKWYKKANELRKDITVVSNERQAQWVIITHERRFRRYGRDLQRYRKREVLKEKVIDGAPIWTVYKAK